MVEIKNFHSSLTFFIVIQCFEGDADFFMTWNRGFLSILSANYFIFQIIYFFYQPRFITLKSYVIIKLIITIYRTKPQVVMKSQQIQFSAQSKLSAKSFQERMNDLSDKLFQKQGDMLILIIGRLTEKPIQNKKYGNLCELMRGHFRKLVCQSFKFPENVQLMMNERDALSKIMGFCDLKQIGCQIDRIIPVKNSRKFISQIEANISQYHKNQNSEYELWFLEDILNLGSCPKDNGNDQEGYVICEFKRNFWEDNQENNDQEKFAENIFQLCREAYFVFYEYCIKKRALLQAKLKFEKNIKKFLSANSENSHYEESENYDYEEFKRSQIHFILFINSDCQKEEFCEKFKSYSNLFEMLSEFFRNFGISLHVVGSIERTLQNYRKLTEQMLAQDEKRREQMQAQYEKMREQMQTQDELMKQLRAFIEQMQTKEESPREK